jgi:hypothetical protein
MPLSDMSGAAAFTPGELLYVVDWCLEADDMVEHNAR